MKKIISVFLCCIVLISAVVIPASAMSLSEGTAKLNRLFKNGVYTNDYDYVYYSPVKDKTDSRKYPLVVWLHGMRSGEYAREQLQYYHFSNWASEEYQSRFVNAGGAFLLAPRVATGAVNSWDSTMCSDLKALIDSFIEKNKDSIDTSRIYIAGYSTGGSMVWSMVTAYPDFFAAAMPLAAITRPNSIGLGKLADVSLWIFTSEKDPYKINDTEDVMPDFEYLARITNRPEGLRLTSCSRAIFADGTRKTGDDADRADHYIWESVTFDMFMEDGKTPYLYASTIGADGKKITLDTPGVGVIDWLSRQSRPSENIGIKLGFLEKIKAFFARITAVFKALFNLNLK